MEVAGGTGGESYADGHEIAIVLLFLVLKDTQRHVPDGKDR